MKTFLKKVITALLSFMWLNSIVEPFIQSTSLRHNTSVSWFLFFIVIVLIFIKSRFFCISLSGFAMVNLITSVFHRGSRPTLRWWYQFFSKLFVQPAGVLMKDELALVSFIVFMVFNAILVTRYKKWIPSFLVILVYLLSLSAVNQSVSRDQMLLFLLISMVAAYWTEIRAKAKVVSLVEVGVIVVSVSLLIMNARSFPRNFSAVHQFIQTGTRTMRYELTNWGFYEFQNLAKKGVVEGIAGFSEFDDQLGGPIGKNSSIVFDVVQTKPHNWRIETKEFYTGKGWTTQSDSLEMLNFPTVIESDFVSHNSKPEIISFKRSKEGIAFLPLPSGELTLKIESLISPMEAQYNVDTRRIVAQNMNDDQLVDIQYELLEPDYSVDDLMGSVVIQDPRSSLNYLQIPDEFPESVHELTLKIIGDETNDYLKVKRIESYLSLRPVEGFDDFNSLRYSQSDTKFTPEDRDFVDYFLFDLRTGYCEHFSSAMVMMLRSIGIPARWAKGYSQGTQTHVSPEGDTYRVTEDNAHAWPEVYFENIGWVPFEPTPTFTNPVEAAIEKEAQKPRDNTNSNQPKPKEEKVKKEHVPKPVVETKKESFDTVGFLKSMLTYAGSLVVLGAVVWMVGQRKIRMILWRYRLNHSKKRMFTDHFEDLLRMMESLEKRHPAQSVKTYLEGFSSCEGYKDIEILYRKYEGVVYGNEVDVPLNDDEKEGFKKLMEFFKNEKRHSHDKNHG